MDDKIFYVKKDFIIEKVLFDTAGKACVIDDRKLQIDVPIFGHQESITDKGEIYE